MATPLSIVHHFTGRAEFTVDGSGNVTAFKAYTTIDLLDALGNPIVAGASGPFPLDLWPQMSAAQKTQIQGIYTAIVGATLPNVTSVS